MIHVDAHIKQQSADVAILDLIQIRTSKQPKQIISSAAIAIKYRLYVAGWVMRTIYMDWVEGDRIYPNDRISLAYDNHIPVGACTYCEVGDEVMIYVKPRYRRKGIGSYLVNATTQNICTKYAYGYGTPGSKQFWEKTVNWPAVL